MSVLDQLEPHARAYMEGLIREGGKPLPELSLEAARRFMRDSQHPPLEHASISVETMAANDVTLTIVRPTSSPQVLPAILYLHGGGWVLGGIETHARIVREIAIRADAAVVFPHYALAPESPFPAAFEQCSAALEWLQSHAAAHAIDPNRLAIAGDSAGANLAAGIALAAGSQFRLQALLCPALHAASATPSYEQFAEGLNLTQDAMQWFWSQYVPNPSDHSDPRASPLLAAQSVLADASPAIIITAECDILRDEGEAYAHRLAQAGVSVTAIRFLGTLHNFIVLDDLADSGPALSALSLIGDALRTALHI